jgi:DNA-directed RNA polymerase subunit RPC12/RpoP
MEPNIDRMSSIIRSLSCQKCHMPFNLRDVEDNRGIVEFYLECRNGHKERRFFSPELDNETLANLYKQFFTCRECYGPTDLVYTEPKGKESRAVFLCPVHGKSLVDIPNSHAPAIQLAYEEIQADKARPPVEVEEVAEPEVIEVEPQPVEEVHEEEGEVKVLRGCEIVGGKFDYKVKVQNLSDYVITNVVVSIVAYPEDCMELAGETVKALSRIEIEGFRSPQFTFYPTKDCVQGKIVATVSYIDYKDRLHTLQVEPYIIRSVCDLLKASEKTSEEFDLILTGLTKTDQEQTLDWNAQVLFTKAEKLLPAKNFHIVDCEEKVAGGQFLGTIRGYAEGKYTSKKVAVIILIAGPEHGRHATVTVEALGEDIAMLPTTIDELADSIDSWICLRCGAPLDPEQVEELHMRKPIRCRYCAHSLTITLYMQ